MAGKTLIGGTAYEIKGGRTLVNGTAYGISGGKTLVGGTAYSISFGAKASTSGKSGVTYSTDLSAITDAKLKEYSMAISDNPAITNTTTAVYIDDGNKHYLLQCGSSYSSKTMTINNSSKSFVIIGFNHDTLTDSSYYGKVTATGCAGITWQCAEALTNAKISNSYGSVSWETSVPRVTTLPTLLSGFSFKNAVAPVNKITNNKNGAFNTNSENLFLLATSEIHGSGYPNNGSRYPWFSAGNSKVKKLNGSAVMWWCRNAQPDPYGNNWPCLNTAGNNSNYNQTNSIGIVPAFCS